ncbi:hypothetical protein HRED_10891, partial [Candidatus Haloredivivus sp. G17]
VEASKLEKNIGEYDLIVAQEIDRLYEESTLYRTEAVELFEDMLKSLKGKNSVFNFRRNWI